MSAEHPKTERPGKESVYQSIRLSAWNRIPNVEQEIFAALAASQLKSTWFDDDQIWSAECEARLKRSNRFTIDPIIVDFSCFHVRSRNMPRIHAYIYIYVLCGKCALGWGMGHSYGLILFFCNLQIGYGSDLRCPFQF